MDMMLLSSFNSARMQLLKLQQVHGFHLSQTQLVLNISVSERPMSYTTAASMRAVRRLREIRARRLLDTESG